VQVQDDAFEPGVAQLLQLAYDIGGAGEIEYPDRHDAHDIALGEHIEVKRDSRRR